MNHELRINHGWSHDLAHFKDEEMRNDQYILYLGGPTENEIISSRFQEATGCFGAHEYIEKYLEQILSHETTHVEIFKAFRDEDIEEAINATKGLDYFDNWGLNPISFSELDPKGDKDG